MQKLNLVSWAGNIFFAAAIAVSCVGPKNTPSSANPAPHIQSAKTNTATVKEGIGERADAIDAHVKDATRLTPKPVLPTIQPHLTGITTETAGLRELQGQLNATLVDLDAAQKESARLSKADAAKAEKIDKLEDEKKGFIRHLMAWLIIFCVIGIGVSGALLYTGNRIGITIGTACVVTLGCAIFVSQYTVWFAVLGAVVMLGGLGYVVYHIVQQRRTGEELVSTVEATKMAMKPAARQYLFGNGAIPGKVDQIQKSPATKQFVKATRTSGKTRLAPPLAATAIE